LPILVFCDIIEVMDNVSKTFHSGRAVFSLMVFICIIAAGAVLKFTASVVLPFTVAVLLAFVMYPLMKSLDKIRCPRAVSILLIVVIIISGLYLFGVILFTSGKVVIDQYPKYENRFTEIYNWASSLLGLPNDVELSFWQNLWGQQLIRTWVRDFTFTLSNTSLRFISNAVLVVIFVVFLLLEAGFFKLKLEAAFHSKLNRINQMGHDLISQVTRYLAAKFLISLANAVIFIIAFNLVGLEFAIVWGAIQFIMNFIPTLGSIVTGVAISLFALLQFWPDPAPVIIVVIIVFAVNMILGNMIDPKIIGDNVGISPLVILISLALWGYIWGFAGMILAVPMTVIVKIACENIPILEPVSILIGSKRAVLAKISESEKRES